MDDDCCTDFWHMVLTAPPQSITREQLDAYFAETRDG